MALSLNQSRSNCVVKVGFTSKHVQNWFVFSILSLFPETGIYNGRLALWTFLLTQSRSWEANTRARSARALVLEKRSRQWPESEKSEVEVTMRIGIVVVVVVAFCHYFFIPGDLIYLLETFLLRGFHFSYFLSLSIRWWRTWFSQISTQIVHNMFP